MNEHLKTLAAAAIVLGGVHIAQADDCIPHQGFDPVYCAASSTPRADQPAGNTSTTFTAYSGSCMPRRGLDPVYCAGSAGNSGELVLGVNPGGSNRRDWSDPLGYHRK